MPRVPLTIGPVADRFGVLTWQVRRAVGRAIADGLMDEPARVGPYRVFFPSQLPQIEAALRKAGYLPREPVHAA